MSIEFEPEGSPFDGYMTVHVDPDVAVVAGQMVYAHKTLEDWNREKQMALTEADMRLTQRVHDEKVHKEFAKKLHLLESYGEDEWAVGTVFKFWKQYAKDKTNYDYAVIKASDGKWYTTGPKSPKGYDWDEFILWLVSGEVPTSPTELILMTEQEPVGGE